MPGKILHSQARQFVLNLYDYFIKERENKSSILPVNAVFERISAALQIGVATAKRIVKKKQITKVDPISPRKRKKKSTKPKDPVFIDDFTKEAIRRVIYNMYSEKKHITLAILLQELKDREICSISTSTLRRTLFDLGFGYRKDCNRRGLCEMDHVVTKRIQFLREYVKNRDETQRPLVFLDETWIFSKGNKRWSWQDKTTATAKSLKGEGKRYIILSAGSEHGFIPGSNLIFAPKSNGEMDAENFEKWLLTALLPNLNEPSVIVLDNAPYHSRLVEPIPNSRWNKTELKEFLKQRNIEFDEKLLQIELWCKARDCRVQKRYAVDEIIKNGGHQVLRLPPYHCHYNAIELVWSQIKRWYDDHIGNSNGKPDEVREMWMNALNTVTAEKWANYVRHTDQVILNDWKEEMGFDMTGQHRPVIINLESDSDDSDEEEEVAFGPTPSTSTGP